MNTQLIITTLLLDVERGGMIQLVDWLVNDGFFEAPASTRFHGSHPGGLADHSLAVYTLLGEQAMRLKLDADTTSGKKPLPIEKDTCIIAGLLHDVCKVGAYVRTKADDGWTNNKAKDKGHAILSIDRIKKFIELTQLEEMMIRFHMGLYGAIEFEQYCGEFALGDFDSIAPDVFPDAEYSLCGDHSSEPKKMTREEKKASKKARYGKSLRNAWYHNPIVKVMYFCDELAVLEAKAKGK